ncbi:MAG TPA: formate--tetrahydrofolate ligase [Planctomycetota bacterium]|nr:formate--tetrahydrofolate ligase [Planctomycetota bacterium]
MKNDLEIARSVALKPIGEIAARAGLLPTEVEPHGHYKAKVALSAIERLKGRPAGRYVVVTAVTPTPLGEGKTVHTIGASLALAKLGKKVFTCLRQPSMGPLFGIKGGAAGGGWSQVVPMEEFNLHLTGDIHAVQAAHNLIAAHVDSSILLKNRFGFDPARVTWRRVSDVNDRAMRDVLIGLGGDENGVPRRTGFDIAVASELMAILALADGLADMRARIGRVVLGYRPDGSAVTAEDAKCAGAAAVILREAIKPTLMQTTEGTPCFVHAGPFANIAHGNSSIVADRLAVPLADYVLTEAGFGADIGCEKFFNIKCRASGLTPTAAVVVTTVRALKMHSGRFRIVPGKPLDPGLEREDLPALEAGIGNLEKQIENVRAHGIPAVVAINRFPSDTDREHDLIRKRSLGAGAFGAEVSEVFAKGGEGGRALATTLDAACEKGGGKFRFLYPLEAPVKEKIDAIARRMYGADGVDFSEEAEADVARYEKLGYGALPICMAKTHLSLTAEPERKGRPTGWRLPIRQVRLSAGAGFLYPLCGEMKTMPGLGSRPGLENVDLDERGDIVGLF